MVDMIARLLILFAFVSLFFAGAMASDITVVIGEVSTGGTVFKNEDFSLSIKYTVVNSESSSETVNNLKLELDLPDSVTGTTKRDLPSMSLDAGESRSASVLIPDLHAIDSGSARIGIKISADDVEVVSSYVFDIYELPEFTVNVYPEDPAVGEMVKLRGDVWPVETVFVGEDVENHMIVVQNRTIGGLHDPAPVLILTDWGSYTTYTDMFGTFEYWIPASQEGSHEITVVVEDKIATATINVKGFGISLKAAPDQVAPGENVVILGKVQLPYIAYADVELRIDGKALQLRTDENGIFRTEFTPDKPGTHKIFALVEWNGQVETKEIEVEVVGTVEENLLVIGATLPSSILAGTTVIVTGTTTRDGPVHADLTIELPNQVVQVNSTGEWVLTFTAPQEPGFYPLMIHAIDSKGRADKEFQLRVIPFSEAIIEVVPNQVSYLPNQTAVINYRVDLTQPIKTDLAIAVDWFGSSVYKETKTFSSSIEGNITLENLQAGDYEISLETLGARGSAKFSVYTPINGYKPPEQPTAENNMTLPILVGLVVSALVIFA